MDEFSFPKLTATEEAIKDKIQNQIYYCLNCQPRDSGEWIWIYGERQDLDELFYEYNLKDEQIEKIASHLVCPFCGTQLERGAEIGLKDFNYDEYEQYYLNAILDDNNFLKSFCNDVSKLRELLKIRIDDSLLKETFLRQLFISQIIILETYLSDAFINIVLSDKEHIKKFVKTFKDFKNEKIDLNNIFDEIVNIEDKVKKTLLKIIYHNLPKVKGIYKATLDIEFPNIEYLAKMISTRHDLVHRNGKTKNGTNIKIDEVIIDNNFDNIVNFVKEIDKQLKKL